MPAPESEMTAPIPDVLIYQSDIVEPRSIEFASRKLDEISAAIAAAFAQGKAEAFEEAEHAIRTITSGLREFKIPDGIHPQTFMRSLNECQEIFAQEIARIKDQGNDA